MLDDVPVVGLESHRRAETRPIIHLLSKLSCAQISEQHRRIRPFLRPSLLLAFLLFALSFSSAGIAEDHPPMSLPGTHLASAQIIQRMMAENQHRADRLRNYSATRRYHVKYTGFPHTLEASMDVQVTCGAPGAKSFRIVNQSGSKLLRERVLQKLLESEEESLKDPSRSALTTANYNFDLVATEGDAAAPTYVFQVDPRHDSKFLYRGTIWVDGSDFAVKRVQAEPAKNPSFWISKTTIAHTYTKIGQFWMPHHNRSETKVRFGGLAVLTIDYSDFRLDVPADSRPPAASDPHGS